MGKVRVALVTGAGRGIGRAIALRLARDGAAVLVAARNREECTAVAAEIRKRGGTAWPIRIDVSDPGSIGTGVEEAIDLSANAGTIDGLVNNAGIVESAPFLAHGRETGSDAYERHLRVNFHGARWMIEALVPGMIERGFGRVVNVASSAGLRSYAYAAAYGASKHALVGYSQAAAQELSRTGVTMNLVCPHYVDSPMTDASVARIVAKTKRSPAETRAFLAKQNPGGTLVSVEEVADVVAELVEGDRNGAIVELVGGQGRLPREETMIWR